MTGSLTNPRHDARPPVDIGAWRRRVRTSLIEQRLSLARETRLTWRLAIDRHLARAFPTLSAHREVGPAIIGFCWPVRNEYDARHTAARLRREGAVTALPVIVGLASALKFRAWRPGVTLAKDAFGIAYPIAGEAVLPTDILLPMVGFDEAGFRLGYGGGYFDRTLATLHPRPRLIGIAHEFLRLNTVHPQAHDIPMDFVVTERGVYRRATESPYHLQLIEP